MTIVIMGRNISSWGRKSDLKICTEAETIRPKMTIRPLDEQALNDKIRENHNPKDKCLKPTVTQD